MSTAILGKPLPVAACITEQARWKRWWNEQTTGPSTATREKTRASPLRMTPFLFREDLC
jgi:hypothetical protein